MLHPIAPSVDVHALTGVAEVASCAGVRTGPDTARGQGLPTLSLGRGVFVKCCLDYNSRGDGYQLDIFASSGIYFLNSIPKDSVKLTVLVTVPLLSKAQCLPQCRVTMAPETTTLGDGNIKLCLEDIFLSTQHFSEEGKYLLC